MKKTCPKCDAEHEKPGKFCSRACANSRQWTDEHKKVFSQKQKEYMARDESEEHRAKKQIQARMLVKAGIMGNRGTGEYQRDIMTNPDDYFLLPPVDDFNKFVSDGDVWETVDDR